MARILVTTTPLSSHVRPSLPVVRELVAAGHDVLWYTGAEFGSLVGSAGADFAPSAVPWSAAPRDRPAAPAGKGIRRLTGLVLDLFINPIPAFVADLEGVFDRFQPDVVVADHSFRAGMFLAERRGVARVALSVGPLNLSSVDTAPFGTGRPPARSAPGRLRNRGRYWWMRHVTGRELQRAAERVRAQLGLPPLGGYFIDWVARIADRYLEASIPEFEYPRSDLPSSVRYVGLLLEAGIDDWTPPPWWPELAAARRDGRPVVFLTQGTLTTDPANLLLPAARALAGDDLLLVATTSGRDPDQVLAAAGQPPNLRLVGFVPYPRVLPLADLMITNGGYGGVQMALSYGVPLVVSGTSEDKRETNTRVVRCGAGVSLGTDTPGADSLGAAARRVLADPAYRANAQRLQAAYARHPGAPLAVAAILEAAGLEPAGLEAAGLEAAGPMPKAAAPAD